MNPELDHELVPAIRNWLATTPGIELPLGLTRQEAEQRAADLLTAIGSDGLLLGKTENTGDFLDVLWASVEKLEVEPVGPRAFHLCDRFYRFVSGLSLEEDPFGELAEMLHRTARAGWRSAPGGLDPVLQARASNWNYGSDKRQREVCSSAAAVGRRIEEIRAGRVPEIGEIAKLSATLYRLTNFKVDLVFSGSLTLYRLLEAEGLPNGLLDECEYLKGLTATAVAGAGRQIGQWSSVKEMVEKAASAFWRTADRGDLERVEVERLLFRFARTDFEAVCAIGPSLLSRITIPRERMRAHLALAWSLINLNRPAEAKESLEAVLAERSITSEPAIHACGLTLLGMVLDDLGLERTALVKFTEAGSILSGSPHPNQEATLMGALGEFLGRRGKLKEAAALYAQARDKYRRLGQLQFLAYYSVLIAETLILLGESEAAEAELCEAIPLIGKLDLRREGMAAAALLNEAVAKTDLKTLRVVRDEIRNASK